MEIHRRVVSPGMENKPQTFVSRTLFGHEESTADTQPWVTYGLVPRREAARVTGAVCPTDVMG
jgi:hypothetical protein